MKRLMCLTLVVLFSLALLSGCDNRTGGTNPVIDFGDVQVILGESQMSRVMGAGYETKLPGGATAIGKLDGNSFLQEFFTAKKDSNTYAYLYIYNPERTAAEVFQTVIYKATIYFPGEEYKSWVDTTLINGVNFYGMNRDEVKAAMEGITEGIKLETEHDSGTLDYWDGAFRYMVRFDSAGIVNQFQIEMHLNKSYK